MLKKSIFSLLFFSLLHAHPTPEALLKNGPFSIDHETFNAIKVQFNVETKKEGKDTEKVFYSFLFYGKRPSTEFTGRNLRFLQLRYEDNYNENSLKNALYFDSFEREFLNLAKNEEHKKIFYALISHLAYGDSKLFIRHLTHYTNRPLKNKYYVNQSKVAFLKKEREYLRAIKDDPTLKDTLISPTQQSESNGVPPQESVIKQNFYSDSSLVNLILKDGDFFLKLQLDQANLFFSNKAHHLHHIDYLGDSYFQEIVIDRNEHLSNQYSFPKTIYLKTKNQEIHKVNFTLFRPMKLKTYNIEEQYTKYKEFLIKNQIISSSPISFIL